VELINSKVQCLILFLLFLWHYSVRSGYWIFIFYYDIEMTKSFFSFRKSGRREQTFFLSFSFSITNSPTLYLVYLYSYYKHGTGYNGGYIDYHVGGGVEGKEGETFKGKR
jgi:hypothetical protein